MTKRNLMYNILQCLQFVFSSFKLVQARFQLGEHMCSNYCSNRRNVCTMFLKQLAHYFQLMTSIWKCTIQDTIKITPVIILHAFKFTKSNIVTERASDHGTQLKSQTHNYYILFAISRCLRFFSK